MSHRHENWLQNLHIATADNINNSDIFLQTFPGTLIKKADKQQIENVGTFQEISENKAKCGINKKNNRKNEQYSTGRKENKMCVTVKAKTSKEQKYTIKKQKSKKQTTRSSASKQKNRNLGGFAFKCDQSTYNEENDSDFYLIHNVLPETYCEGMMFQPTPENKVLKKPARRTLLSLSYMDSMCEDA